MQIILLHLDGIFKEHWIGEVYVLIGSRGLTVKVPWEQLNIQSSTLGSQLLYNLA